MIQYKLLSIFLFWAISTYSSAQIIPENFRNPILPGFNPDPSVCRVGDDYYLVTSSFTWFPGIPIYHSKDLVNWKLIGHGITRPDQFDFDKITDDNGIWAVTIRYHEGLFYLITTCNRCGGNFYITAKDPAGEWSDPVWLEEAEGIDPSLFWEDDGTCYYTGNSWGFTKSWSSQCAVWTQELDLENQTLVGKRKFLTYGHANNARYAEGPHIYKIDGKYLLLMSEGGSAYNHAISAHHGNNILDTYIADQVNPVLTHRQLGKDYPVHTIGHADLVQTQHGDWWAVALGIRDIAGKSGLTRETFLCKVEFENGTPIFNPGYGKVRLAQERPALPWSPLYEEATKEDFDTDSLSLKWHTIRTPKQSFYSLKDGSLSLHLLPEVTDSMVHSSMLIQRIKDQDYSATTKLSFSTKKDNEQAGLIMYRNNNSYYLLLKEKSRLVLIRKFQGKRVEVASCDYDKKDVFLRVDAEGRKIQFCFGTSPETMTKLGEPQDLEVLAEGNGNRFNGPGVGVYATSNGQRSGNSASFDWFEYKPSN
ncbi:MAG: glycoside hydrolase family 43 protein [Mangrovibacterium sp.]|tara:strand:- start:4780 stop:6381 length:1602 start_codon:yes stop_codon:yes gene_type:complete